MCRELARTCACFNFRRVTRRVTQMFDEALLPLGVRSTQLVVLLALRIHGPTSTAALARELGMERSTLTRNLKPLLDMGLVMSDKGPAGRIQSITISDKGLQTIMRAYPYWQRAQDKIVASVGAKKWGRITQDLDKIAEIE